MRPPTLVAIPALNEAGSLAPIGRSLRALQEAAIANERFDVVIIDDGSSDETSKVARNLGWFVLRHQSRRGYGAALMTALCHASTSGYRHVVTMDADGQHPVELVPEFIRIREGGDVISGSRYLPTSLRVSEPLAPHLNQFMTAVLRELFGLPITDVGCGMKCISLEKFRAYQFIETGYLFPVEFWVKAWQAASTIQELAVPMIYLDRTKTLERKFGSIEELVDRAVFVVVRALLGLHDAYSADFGMRLRILVPPSRDLYAMLSTLEQLLNEKGLPHIPVGAAVNNLSRLISRLRGEQ